jgi:type II secretory pathway component PulF
VFPLAITEVMGQRASRPTFSRRTIPSSTIAYMTRQLADLLGGGLPLLGALTLLAKQTEHRPLQQVIDSLSASVRDGQSLSAAMAHHPGVFSTLYINMVKAGEVGGGLEAVLVRLADLGEADAELRGRVVNALVYPAVVLGIGLITVGVLLVYVIPKITGIFAESGQLLPLPTRILLTISNTVTQWWWALLLGVSAVVWLTRQWRLDPHGRQALDQFVLRLPLVGTLSRKLETARFTRNLGVMVGQGVPVLQALEIGSHNVSNVVIQRALRQVQEAVRDGASIASALSASGQFPVFVSNMVAVGEESGTVDAALLKVAVAYEREVDRTMRTLTTVLEPLLIVVVGLIVMFIVISMLLPIFNIGLVAQ